jgi:hypothetical protein
MKKWNNMQFSSVQKFEQVLRKEWVRFCGESYQAPKLTRKKKWNNMQGSSAQKFEQAPRKE